MRREAQTTGGHREATGVEASGVVWSPAQPIIDERGEIRNLLNVTCGSVLVMTSIKGAVRGNHYHKTDCHYSWLQRGGLIYFHRPFGDTKPPQRWVITPGRMVYTPPGYEHAMQFTEDSVLFVFARNNREMARYEEDTVRTSLIAPGALR